MIKEFLELSFKNLIDEQKRQKTLENAPVVSLYVAKKIDYKRYELIVNKKKIICVSLKELCIGKYYWAIISKDSYGIITLSKLQIQPMVFQEQNFISFEVSLGKILNILLSPNYKQEYIDLLQYQKKLKFDRFVYCLQKDILSFPLYLFDEIMFLQFQIKLNGKIKYYFAFKNFGAYSGIVTKDNFSIEGAYNGIYTNNVFLKKISINPLCNISYNIIDIET